MKKRIVRIFSRLNTGGPTLHVVNLTKGLENFGYETDLLVGQIGHSEGSMEFYAQEQNVHPILIPFLGPHLSFINDLRTFFWLLFYFLKNRPDIVHTHTFKAGLLGRLAAWLSGVPTIIHTYHGHLLNGYWGFLKTRILILIESLLGKISTMTLAVSAKVAEDLIHAQIVPPQKIRCLELGFDLSYLNSQLFHSSSLRKQLKIPENAFVIASVGRMVPIKSMDLFLKGTVPLLNHSPQIHLVLIGDGPCRKDLEDLSKILCQKNSENLKRIHFTGWIYPFPKELKDINLFVCSSKNEGTSVAAIEALIAEVPVVSTCVGGMPDLLNNGTAGILINQNPRELQQACQQIFLQSKNPEYKKSLQKISQQTQLRFDQKRLFADITKLYKELHG